MRQGLIFLGILLMLFSFYASAFTPTTNRYIAGQAFPEYLVTCSDKLLSGAVTVTDPGAWETNPDFKPQNWVCQNNATDCASKKMAQKYLQNAFKENDQCAQAYELGIYSTFYAFSQTPSQWLNVEPNCQGQFETNIEKHITTHETTWNEIDQCNVLGQSGAIALTFTNTDLNKVITDIKTQKENFAKDQNTEQATQNFDLDKISSLQVVQEILDKNKNLTVNGEQLNAKTLQELYDYTCPLSESRIQDYYAKWQQLDPTGKQCLQTFLAQNTSNAYSLAGNCYALNAGGNGTFNATALSYAQFELQDYTTKGFAQTTCQTLNFPTPTIQGQPVTDQNQGPETTTPGLSYQVCEFKPMNIPQGCVIKFQEDDKKSDNKYNEGAQNGALTTVAAFLLGGLIVYTVFSYGG